MYKYTFCNIIQCGIYLRQWPPPRRLITLRASLNRACKFSIILRSLRRVSHSVFGSSRIYLTLMRIAADARIWYFLATRK